MQPPERIDVTGCQYIYIYICMKKNTIKIRNSQNNNGKLYVFNLL
jgi:hypothetical protein